MQREGLELGNSWLTDWRPGKHGQWGFTFHKAIFDKVIQLLLHSKVAKAELCLIGGYHNELLELNLRIDHLTVYIDFKDHMA